MNRDRIEGTVKKMGGAAAAKVSKIAERPDFAARSAKIESEGTVQQLFGSAQDMIESGLDYAGRALRSTGESARRGWLVSQEKVSANPMKSVAAATVIGAGLGLLVTSLLRSRR